MTQITIDADDELNTWLAHLSIDLSFHDKRMVIIKLLKDIKERMENEQAKP